MPEYAFEDLTPGLAMTFGPLVVDRDAIIAFAREYDPQPFHVDEKAAADSFAGGLIASGWHTCSLAMRLFADGLVLRSTSMGSPGVEEVRWLKPVRPGDVLTAGLVVQDARASKSRLDRGMVHFAIDLAKVGGETVMTQDFWVMFARRGAVPGPRPPIRRDASAVAHGPMPSAPRPRPYLDDLVPGTTETFPPFHFSRETIVAFARAYDPQPFHIDEAAGRESHFGGLIASGWQTAAAWMRQMLVGRAGLVDEGARLGPSPGFRKLQWLAPVYAGDTITYDSTITGTRPSASRPGWGLVFLRNTGRNQYGEPVFAFEGTVLWERRPGA